MTIRDRHGRPHDERGRFVSAERTTETRHTRETRVTERFTIHHGHEDTSPIVWTPGWAHGPDLLEARHHHHAHLGTQVAACEDFLWKAVISGEMTAAQTGSWDTFTHELPELIRRAVVILTSGPEATPLELTDGRSV